MKMPVVPDAQPVLSVSFKGKLGTQNRLYRLSSKGNMQFIDNSILRENFGEKLQVGFRLFYVDYSLRGPRVYHEHLGGERWTPTVPANLGKPGDEFEVTVGLLNRRIFTAGLPDISMRNKARLPWMSETTRTKYFSSQRRRFSIKFRQSPPIGGCEEFEIQGEKSYLHFHLGKTDLRFFIRDAVGQERELAIYHDGHSDSWLGIRRGREFYRVSLVSSDGYRLRVTYTSAATVYNVTTIYLVEPSALYELHPLENGTESVTHPWGTRRSLSFEVTFKRKLEKLMTKHGGTYDAGRIGAEIAFTFAKQVLGINRLILPDPNSPGNDLYDERKTTVVQTRLLIHTNFISDLSVHHTIMRGLKALIWKFRQDFAYNPTARTGYAILSYISKDKVRTLAFELARK